jgi:hypothetical protein
VGPAAGLLSGLTAAHAVAETSASSGLRGSSRALIQYAIPLTVTGGPVTLQFGMLARYTDIASLSGAAFGPELFATSDFGFSVSRPTGLGFDEQVFSLRPAALNQVVRLGGQNMVPILAGPGEVNSNPGYGGDPTPFSASFTLAAGSYSILLSGGIVVENAAGTAVVPEPGSLGLTIAGLALVVGAVRRAAGGRGE